MSYTPNRRRVVATRHGSAADRARAAIARTTGDLLDLDQRCGPIFARAGRGRDVDDYHDAAARALDEAAEAVARIIAPITRERDRLHAEANGLEREHVASARRVSSPSELGRPTR